MAAKKKSRLKAKKKGSKIPTPVAKYQKGNAKPQSMKKRSAY